MGFQHVRRCTRPRLRRVLPQDTPLALASRRRYRVVSICGLIIHGSTASQANNRCCLRGGAWGGGPPARSPARRGAPGVVDLEAGLPSPRFLAFACVWCLRAAARQITTGSSAASGGDLSSQLCFGIWMGAVMMCTGCGALPPPGNSRAARGGLSACPAARPRSQWRSPLSPREKIISYLLPLSLRPSRRASSLGLLRLATG